MELSRITRFHLESDEARAGAGGHYNVAGELPEKDIWVLTMGVTDSREITSLRLDTLPKPQGGRWPDKNVALREMKVEKVDAAGQVTPIQLVNPRAGFTTWL